MSINSKTEVKAGTKIWVIERDENGDACDFFSYIFLAEVDEYVIVSPNINDLEQLNEIMKYHSNETIENYTAKLGVFPATDCFSNKNEAQEIYKKACH